MRDEVRFAITMIADALSGSSAPQAVSFVARRAERFGWTFCAAWMAGGAGRVAHFGMHWKNLARVLLRRVRSLPAGHKSAAAAATFGKI